MTRPCRFCEHPPRHTYAHTHTLCSFPEGGVFCVSFALTVLLVFLGRHVLFCRDGPSLSILFSLSQSSISAPLLSCFAVSPLVSLCSLSCRLSPALAPSSLLPPPSSGSARVPARRDSVHLLQGCVPLRCARAVRRALPSRRLLPAAGPLRRQHRARPQVRGLLARGGRKCCM